MKTPLLFLAATFSFILFFSNASAQLQGAYLIQNGAGPGGAPCVIELSDNQTLLISYSSFGYDSSYVSMVWLDATMTITQHKEFRLAFPLNFVFHAVKCADEILIGTLEYSSFSSPFSIIRTDESGNILQYDLSVNNPNYQEKIKQLVANENGSFTAYTSKSGMVDAMYRIDGNLGDSNYYTQRITPVITNNYFRPFNACDVNGDGLHMLTGSVNDFANLNQNTFIMNLDSADIHWTKMFDYGAPSGEEAYNVIKLADGNFAFIGLSPNINTNLGEGFITVTDSEGDNVWSKKIGTSGGSIFVSAIVQTSEGDILVFGNNSSYQGIMVKLSSAGDVIWTRRFAAGGYTGFTNAIRQENDQILAVGVSGGFLLNQLNEEGDGCMWVDDATITVTDIVPTVEEVVFQYTPEVVSFSSYAVNPRNLTTTNTELCISTNGLQEETEASANLVYPNPAADVCYLNNASNELQPYAIYDHFGKKVAEGQFRYQKTLSLADFSDGIYLVRFYNNGKEEVVRLVKMN